jgi:hypothetical protein
LKRRTTAVVVGAALVLLVLSVFIVYPILMDANVPKKDSSFYVGVTYCGNSTTDAKLLIDKVKNYTNLFILQSGSLQEDQSASTAIGDYAVQNGLYFLTYLGVENGNRSASWAAEAMQRWGEKFLGVYYGDEPGGKMLDSYVALSPMCPQGQVTKLGNGGVNLAFENQTRITYFLDGSITMLEYTGDSTIGTLTIKRPGIMDWERIPNVPKPDVGANYTYPNGTSILWTPLPELNQITYYPNGTFSSQNGKAQNYETILTYNPLGTCDKAAQAFVNANNGLLQDMKNQSVKLFTSDYGLYWWDYQSGYDVVLAQFGWNNSINQQIALTRGAATAHNKSWGAIITWTYNKEPYLVNGTEMLSQMTAAYRAGAEYVAIFNYPTIEGSQYGILQEEHFDALLQFWNDVVQNPKIANGEASAQAALVLPDNYGWGMRIPSDIIWGTIKPNATSQQVWSLMQNKLANFGDRLDIVFDEPAKGTYADVYYWNQG